ncbi:MAG TPA: hypothetical protein VMM80_10865 [Bacteroidota bacterium]|nr:hypothetical protein [Bacteroidota bacterium]
MRRNRIHWLCWLGFVALVAAGPARALSFAEAGQEAGKVIGKLLGKKAETPRPVPAAQDARTAPAATTPQAAPAPADAPGGRSGGEARPDTSIAGVEAMDDILLTPEPYVYQSVGRRDPFVSLVDDTYLQDHEEEGLLLSDLQVTGILWGEHDRFALIETTSGESYIARQGDHVGRYTVSEIDPGGVTLYDSRYGVGQTERLKLTEQKGTSNGRETH